MNEEQQLIEKLRAIHALYDGATSEGERRAASLAYARVNERLREQRFTQAQPYKFTFADHYNRRVFLALVRKHGLKPYRKYRQRRTTVMVDVSEAFVNEVLWPEYLRLSEVLDKYLDGITNRVIREAIHEDSSDAAVAGQLEG